MSDYVDDMLEGIFCQVCGIIMLDEDEEAPGYPQSCEECSND